MRVHNYGELLSADDYCDNSISEKDERRQMSANLLARENDMYQLTNSKARKLQTAAISYTLFSPASVLLEFYTLINSKNEFYGAGRQHRSGKKFTTEPENNY